MNEDEMLNHSLIILKREYLLFVTKSTIPNKNCFFHNSTINEKFLDLIITFCDIFFKNNYIKYFTIHLVDKFYSKHIKNVIHQFKELETEEEKKNNSWDNIIFRLKKQLPLRIITCIFISVKYKFRSYHITIDDCLKVLNKLNYKCSYCKFVKSEIRILKEISFDLESITLLDYVFCLLILLKNNLDINSNFYFPHIYDLIDIMYSIELTKNLNNKHKSFLVCGTTALCLIPILIGHPQTEQIFNEIINITKIEPSIIINSRLKYLRIIVNDKMVNTNKTMVNNF